MKISSQNYHIKTTLIRATMLCIFVSCLSMTQAATYYVDNTGGNDANNGTAIASAWKTLTKVNSVTFTGGDTLLFKAGSSWTGQLYPLGSGTSGNPVIIDMYSSGAKPVIAASGTKDGAVYLYNQQYWEINNLEVTNQASSLADLRGISITGKDFGTLNHIYIKKCFVHDVSGEVKWISGSVDDNATGITFETGWDASKRTGGIVFEILEPGSSPVKTFFNDVIVENCKVSDCSFGCIIFKQWDGDVNWGVRSSATDATWLPHKNIIIRNNYLSQLNTSYGCNTIYLTDVRNAVVENNVCEGAGTSAIELYYADSVVIQKNETYNTIKKAGGADYNGIDPDKGTTNIIVQYNYSHDNGDGILLCQFSFGSSCVRYNILQNNSRYQIYLHSDSKATSVIYNNTVYNDQKTSCIVYGYGDYITASYTITNNIFYSAKTNATITTGGGITYNNNCYYGSSVTAPSTDANMINSDPQMTNPGKGGNGDTSGPALSSLDGYKLKSTSPCINAGVSISSNGGKDFWGGALYNGAADIGSHEYNATSLTPDCFQIKTLAQNTPAGTGKISVINALGKTLYAGRISEPSLHNKTYGKGIFFLKYKNGAIKPAGLK